MKNKINFVIFFIIIEMMGSEDCSIKVNKY